MPRPVSDAPTFERILPWVTRLPKLCVQIVARDGTPEDPPLGSFTLAPTDREAVATSLAELLDSAAAAAGRTITVNLVGFTKAKPCARFQVRVAAPGSSELSTSADMNVDVNALKVLTGHAHQLTQVVVHNTTGLVDVFRQALAAMGAESKTLREQLSAAEGRARDAEDKLRQAAALAEDAIIAKERGDGRNALGEQLGNALTEKIVSALPQIFEGQKQLADTIKGEVVPAPPPSNGKAS